MAAEALYDRVHTLAIKMAREGRVVPQRMADAARRRADPAACRAVASQERNAPISAAPISDGCRFLWNTMKRRIHIA